MGVWFFNREYNMRLKLRELLELLKLLKLLICRCFLSLPRFLSVAFENHFEYSWRRRCLGLGRTGGKISDHRQRRLLRPRGKRPHSGSAANDFDEVASSHCRRIGSKDVSGRGRTTRGYVRFGSKASGAGQITPAACASRDATPRLESLPASVLRPAGFRRSRRPPGF